MADVFIIVFLCIYTYINMYMYTHFRKLFALDPQLERDCSVCLADSSSA